MKAILILFLLSTLIGCGSQESNKEVTKEKGKNSDTVSEVEVDTVHLEEAFVVGLVTDAFERRWRVEVADYNENSDASFEIDGMLFRYFSSDIDTPKEMIEYLNDVYTEQCIEEITKNIFSNQLDGKLYHTDGEMGTLMNWGKSSIELIESNHDRKLYLFSVPAGDAMEEHNVELLKSIDGWKVNTLLAY